MVGKYKINHADYAGEIYPGDFDIKLYMSNMADRIRRSESFNKGNQHSSRNQMKEKGEG